MTNFRDKARQIKAEAESERGEFTPTGAPMRAYNYWLENHFFSKRANRVRAGRERENFCHFWRVVAIWAPLTFLARKAQKTVTSPVFLVFAALVAIVGILGSGVAIPEFGRFLLFIAAVAGGLMWLLFGLIAGHAITDPMKGRVREYDPDDWTTWGDPAPYNSAMSYDTARKYGWLSPVGMAISLLWIKAEKWEHTPNILIGMLMLTVVGLIVVGTVGIIIEYGWLMLLLGALGAAAAVAAFVGLMFLGAFVGDWISAKRKEAARKRAAAREARRQERLENGLDEDLPEQRELTKFELMLFRWGTNVADFLVLLGQVVRTKKWKICPLVEVDTK